MSDFTGSCLCKAVTFQGNWSARDLRACHCTQCRKWSGHIWAGAAAEGVTIEGPVKWFRSSEKAERGFCPECGSSLFWRRVGSESPEVSPGAIDGDTGLQLAGHIFVADKGDYYQITDGLPCEAAGD